jgi:hypothetical protein
VSPSGSLTPSGGGQPTTTPQTPTPTPTTPAQ